jgi:hypothetical protein
VFPAAGDKHHIQPQNMRPKYLFLSSNNVLFALLLVLAQDRCACARLGESPAQIEQRYGRPTDMIAPNKPADVARVFLLKGYSIRVHFWRGTAGSEIYQKTDKMPLTDADIQMFLQANSNGEHWDKVPGAPGKMQMWLTKDGMKMAATDPNQMTLNISTFDYFAETDAGKEIIPPKDLKGF